MKIAAIIFTFAAAVAFAIPSEARLCKCNGSSPTQIDRAHDDH